MSWKKILFLCLSFVFVFGGVFGFGEKVLAAETYTDAQVGWGLSFNSDQTNGAKIVKNSKGDLFTQNSSGQVSAMTKFSANTGSGTQGTAQNYYVNYDAKAGKNVYFRSVNAGGSYNVVNGSEWDRVNDKYYEYSQTQEALQESANDTTPVAQQAAEEIKTEQAKTDASAAARDKKNADAAAGNTKGSTFSCSWTDGFNAFCWAAKFSNDVILSGVGLISGIAGYLFDQIIDFSVVKMGNNVKIADGEYLSDAWKIMRDVVNIAFIFVLLYIGIMTIVKGFESGTSKMIATVIVVALVINFSLFFTKIIIDVSNIVAVNFYETIKTNTGSSDSKWSGVAGAFLNTLKLGTINDDLKAEIKGNSDGMYLNIIKISLGGSVILIILALVLFIASIMFITRYIILIMLLVTSSAAIGSWILPSLKKSVYDKWWSALIGQAFFAPVFLFFLFLSLKMTEGLTSSLLSKKGDLKWSDIFKGDPSSAINLIIMYLVVVGFLVGAIVISKSLSNMAGSSAGKITGFMGGAALGGAALIGRNTVGRGAGVLANKMGDPKSGMGLFVKNRLTNTSKRTFDARNSSGVASMLGNDMGKGTSKNYSGLQKKRDEAAAENAKQISDEINPSDPQGRTYREIYSQSKLRLISPGGIKLRSSAVQRQELSNKKKNIEASIEQTKKDMGHGAKSDELKKIKDEEATLNQALSSAIAGAKGNMNDAGVKTIKADLENKRKEAAAKKKEIDNIEEAYAEQAKQVESISKKLAGKETSNADLLKELQKINKAS